MQKRFCSCGQVIMVEYLFSIFSCDTMFHSADLEGGPLLACPHCGNPLDINSLR